MQNIERYRRGLEDWRDLGYIKGSFLNDQPAADYGKKRTDACCDLRYHALNLYR